MNKKLKASIRTKTGKKLKSIREDGLIPGVVYGKGIENVVISVDKVEFDKLVKEAGENTLLDLEIEKEKPRTVLIQNITLDPLNYSATHIDFYQVRLDQKVKSEVPLSFVGESKAVKDLNGTLIKSIQSLEVESLPSNIPQELEVDISRLDTFEDSIKVSDIALPAGVKAMVDEEETIAVVSPPRTEAEMESLSDELVEDVSAVEGVSDGEEKPEGAPEDKGDKGGKSSSEDKPQSEKKEEVTN